MPLTPQPQKKIRKALWKCMECGKKFYSDEAAMRAESKGCPKCGSTDIDINF
jgi:DNA-directed RNA polymerase subunit RPC12/RpoP